MLACPNQGKPYEIHLPGDCQPPHPADDELRHGHMHPKLKWGRTKTSDRRIVVILD